ncbi:hypothetical protein [Nonomuraea sp. NPDC049141]|uniref:hypothetical protein n=1 Tax=unclassified Nonomuraea TaxID=2593643 RepID=UPI0033C63B80
MSSTQKYACRSVFTEVGGADSGGADSGGADSGGGAVLVVQLPPGAADGDVAADADASADMEQAATRTAAQRALIMAASVA